MPSHKSVPTSVSKDAGVHDSGQIPDIARQVHQIVVNAPSDAPLPTTRELGEKFGVANTTVFRVLQKLVAEEIVWQHPNGRYYPATSRALLHRPKPVACLMRRLELCSELYRELLEGISAGCGANRRTMLLWHDELLVNHADVSEEPSFATTAQQRAILTDFLDRHGDTAGGFVFDHVWQDIVLGEQAARIASGVVLFRACSVEAFGNIRADFRAGALMALTHLLARGYEQIIPVEPFSGDPAVSEFFSALALAVEELGCRRCVAPIVRVGSEVQRNRLLTRLRETKGRTALLFPEDNIATVMLKMAKTAGLNCPKKIGMMSAMGTDFATKAGLSCLHYDLRALGRLAVEALGSAQPVRCVLPPQFSRGTTT